MKGHGRPVCILAGPASLMLVSIHHFGSLENQVFAKSWPWGRPGARIRPFEPFGELAHATGGGDPHRRLVGRDLQFVADAASGGGAVVWRAPSGQLFDPRGVVHGGRFRPLVSLAQAPAPLHPQGRFSHRRPVLGFDEPARRHAPVAGAAHQFLLGPFRVGLGHHHHRRHGAHRPRRHAPFAALLPPAAPMDGRDGAHRVGAGGAAHAGHRRHAALPRRGAGAHERGEAHPPHGQYRPCPVDDLPWHDRSLRHGILVGGHVPVRCHRPQFLHAFDRWLFHP